MSENIKFQAFPDAKRMQSFTETIASGNFLHEVNLESPYMKCDVGKFAVIPERVKTVRTFVTLFSNFASKYIRETAAIILKGLKLPIRSRTNISSDDPYDTAVPGQDEAIAEILDENSTNPARRRLLQIMVGDMNKSYTGTPVLPQYQELCRSYIPDLNRSLDEAYICPLAKCIINAGTDNPIPQQALSICQLDSGLTAPGAERAMSECVLNIVCRVSSQCAPNLFKRIFDYLEQPPLKKGKISAGERETFKRRWDISPALGIYYLLNYNKGSDVEKFVRREVKQSQTEAKCVNNVRGEIESDIRLLQASYKLQTLVYWQYAQRESQESFAKAREAYEDMLDALGQLNATKLEVAERVTRRIEILNKLREGFQQLQNLTDSGSVAVDNLVSLRKQSLENNNATILALYDQVTALAEFETVTTRSLKLALDLMQLESDDTLIYETSSLDKATMTYKVAEALVNAFNDMKDEPQLESSLIKQSFLAVKEGAGAGLKFFGVDQGQHPRDLTGNERFIPLVALSFSYGIPVPENSSSTAPMWVVRKTIRIRCDAVTMTGDREPKTDFNDVERMIGPNFCYEAIENQSTIYTRTNIDQDEVFCQCWGRMIEEVSDDADVIENYVNNTAEIYKNDTSRRQALSEVLSMPPFNSSDLAFNGTRRYNITGTTNFYTAPQLVDILEHTICRAQSDLVFSGADLAARAQEVYNFSSNLKQPFNASLNYFMIRARTRDQVSAAMFMSVDPNERDYCVGGIRNKALWDLMALDRKSIGYNLHFWTYNQIAAQIAPFMIKASSKVAMARGRAMVPVTAETFPMRYKVPSFLNFSAAPDEQVSIANATNRFYPSAPAADTLGDTDSDSVGYVSNLWTFSMLSVNGLPVYKVYNCRIVEQATGLSTLYNGSEVLSVKPTFVNLQTYDAEFFHIPPSFYIADYLTNYAQRIPVDVTIMDPQTNMVTGVISASNATAQIGSLAYSFQTTPASGDGYAFMLHDIPQNLFAFGRTTAQRAGTVCYYMIPVDPSQSAARVGANQDPSLDGPVYQMQAPTYAEWREYSIGDMDPRDGGVSPSLFRQSFGFRSNASDFVPPGVTNVQYLPYYTDLVCDERRRNYGGICSIADYFYIDYEVSRPDEIRFYPRNWYYEGIIQNSPWKEVNATLLDMMGTDASPVSPAASSAEGRRNSGCPDSVEVVNQELSFTNIFVRYNALPTNTTVVIIEASECSGSLIPQGTFQKNITNFIPFATTSISVPGCASQTVSVSVVSTPVGETSPRHVICTTWAANPQPVSLSTFQNFAVQIITLEEDKNQQLIVDIGVKISEAKQGTGQYIRDALAEIMTKSISEWTNETRAAILALRTNISASRDAFLNATLAASNNADTQLAKILAAKRLLEQISFLKKSANNSLGDDAITEILEAYLGYLALEGPAIQILNRTIYLAQPIQDALRKFNVWTENNNAFNTSDFGILAVVLSNIGFTAPHAMTKYLVDKYGKINEYHGCRSSWLDVFKCMDGNMKFILIVLVLVLVEFISDAILFVIVKEGYFSSSESSTDSYNKTLHAGSTPKCRDGGKYLRVFIVLLVTRAPLLISSAFLLR